MKRLADVFKIISTAFPETLTRMIIVNPPAGFNMLWMAVQPMLNQRIKQKFVFIPDGVFEFPQKLAAMVGTAPLQALADLGPVVHEVFPVQPVSGAVSGHCGPLGLSGLLWFTWYNDSWTSTMQVKDLKISVNSSGEDELLRNPSSSSVLLQPLGPI
ncbi:SEC14-like protein 5 [Durusdinium trenchii]|uniref:SEC14-like protein 5 n=1 Tax=Durusdinium trenchii TaxID=1381693 RepID=A0ABP0R730_9DINO